MEDFVIFRGDELRHPAANDGCAGGGFYKANAGRVDFENHAVGGKQADRGWRSFNDGPQMRLAGPQLRGSGRHLFFQARAVRLQLDVPPLDLFQHLIEPVHQNANFITSPGDDSNGVVFFRGDPFRRIRQLQDGLGNRPLQPRRDSKRQAGCKDQNEEGNRGSLPKMGLQLPQV